MEGVVRVWRQRLTGVRVFVEVQAHQRHAKSNFCTIYIVY